MCVGCFRVLDEIAAWAGFSDDERQAVLEKLEARRLIYEAQEKIRQDAPEQMVSRTLDWIVSRRNQSD